MTIGKRRNSVFLYGSWFLQQILNECRLYGWPSSLITSQLQNLKSKESWIISDEDPNEDVRF